MDDIMKNNILKNLVCWQKLLTQQLTVKQNKRKVDLSACLGTLGATLLGTILKDLGVKGWNIPWQKIMKASEETIRTGEGTD